MTKTVETDIQPEFLGVTNACIFVSLSRRTLDAAKARGEISFIKMGAKILYRRSDLIDFMEARRVDVRSDIERMSKN